MAPIQLLPQISLVILQNPAAKIIFLKSLQGNRSSQPPTFQGTANPLAYKGKGKAKGFSQNKEPWSAGSCALKTCAHWGCSDWLNLLRHL